MELNIIPKCVCTFKGGIRGNFYTFSTILIEADKYYLLWWNCHNFSCCSNWREFGNSEVGIVWLFRFIKFWATICCGKNEGASIWFSSAKFLLLVVSGQSWMGDSSPASHGPTLTALTPTSRPSFLPTLLAEISLGHFIQWGREGHPTDNYSLLSLSRLCLHRALPSFGYMCGRATANLPSQPTWTVWSSSSLATQCQGAGTLEFISSSRATRGGSGRILDVCVES